jgi:hypothetical protein
MSTRVLLVPILLVSIAATGCVHRRYDHDHRPGDRSGVRRGHGPPPHAPAHGYRAKHRGIGLEFDSRRGVYVVLGFPGVYFYGGWYYRLALDRWLRSNRHDGPWKDARWGDVPYGLRGDRYPEKGKGKGKGKYKRKRR